MYLIFEYKTVAVDRADEEGRYNNLSYWVNGVGSRWVSKPVATADGKWALNVLEYNLDDIEEESVVVSFLHVKGEI